MTVKTKSLPSVEDAASIGFHMCEAAERVRVADMCCPGAVTVVHLFVDGIEFTCYVQVKRNG